MKQLNSYEISQVSGAAGKYLTELGLNDFYDLLVWAEKNDVGLAKSSKFFTDSESGLKEDYFAWAKDNHIDAIASAKLNNWKL